MRILILKGGKDALTAVWRREHADAMRKRQIRKDAEEKGLRKSWDQAGLQKERGIRGFIWRIRLRQMDFLWHLSFGSCFEVFPPSFYHTHTDEEIERAHRKFDEEYDRLLEELRLKK